MTEQTTEEVVETPIAETPIVEETLVEEDGNDS